MENSWLVGSSSIAQGDRLGSVLCDDLDGEIGRRLKREGIWGHVYAYG